MALIPEDIQREWLSVIRRLQSESKSEGLSVLSIKILVDKDGKPVAWTSPVQTKIEPKSAQSALLAMFTDQDHR